LERVVDSFHKSNWSTFLTGVKSAIKLVEQRAADPSSHKSLTPALREQWKNLAAALAKVEAQHQLLKHKFAFAFVEGTGTLHMSHVTHSLHAGPLIKAITEGHWILFDEINLASHEALEVSDM
jgi:midasin